MFSVESTPSKLVSSRPDFSPTDLHKHAFWVTTDRGEVNMLAYSEQAYVCWIKKLQQLVEKHIDDAVDEDKRSTDGGECKESGRKEERTQESSGSDLMPNTPLTQHQFTTLSSLPATSSEPGVADYTRPSTPPIASSTPIPAGTIDGKSRLDTQPFNPKQLEII